MATQLSVPAKVSVRMKDALKRFQPILSSALARDVNESDTATIITDLLAEMFGYDKFHEVTSEHMIRGTFCDLAVEIEGKLRLLIEVKAIGMDLKEKHMRQAANYAANQGLEWVVLTNGINWQVYKMDFGQQIREELLVEFNLLEITPRDTGALEQLYLLSKEGMSKAVLPDYYIHKQATNRFVLGALVMSDPVVAIIRRELKKVAPGVKVDIEYLRGLLEREVLKREVVEGEPAEEARKKVQKALAKESKGKMKKEPGPVGGEAEMEAEDPPPEGITVEDTPEI